MGGPRSTPPAGRRRRRQRPGALAAESTCSLPRERAGEVVTKREILAEVRRQVDGGGERTVDVHLSWLRRQLGESAAASVLPPQHPRRGRPAVAAGEPPDAGRDRRGSSPPRRLQSSSPSSCPLCFPSPTWPSYGPRPRPQQARASPPSARASTARACRPRPSTCSRPEGWSWPCHPPTGRVLSRDNSAGDEGVDAAPARSTRGGATERTDEGVDVIIPVRTEAGSGSSSRR